MTDTANSTARRDADPDMSLIDAIHARRSVRGYLQKEIPQATLHRIFEIAQQAPSNCNVQPWQVFVATGALRDRLSRQMVEYTKQGVEPTPDYPYNDRFTGAYRKRQVDCAVALYNEMGVERHDREGRLRAVLRNFEFFDAPYMAFIGMDQSFGTTVAVDVGMYAQNLMLTMTAFGIGSCPMGTMRQFPGLIRKEFGIGEETKILFGIAFGYEDPAVPANRTRTTRDAIDANVVFKDQ